MLGGTGAGAGAGMGFALVVRMERNRGRRINGDFILAVSACWMGGCGASEEVKEICLWAEELDPAQETLFYWDNEQAFVLFAGTLC